MGTQKHKFFKHKHQGFTLMEMMVVITLIGIMASMIGPGYLDFYRRKNINYSTQILQTSLSEGFSSARSKPMIFGIEGKKGNQEINIFSCDYPTCTNKTNLHTESFLGKVKIDSNDFEIRFTPPHGNISYFAENGSENTTDETFEISLKNKYPQKTKIYKKSGLIEKTQ